MNIFKTIKFLSLFASFLGTKIWKTFEIKNLSSHVLATRIIPNSIFYSVKVILNLKKI